MTECASSNINKQKFYTIVCQEIPQPHITHIAINTDKLLCCLFCPTVLISINFTFCSNGPYPGSVGDSLSNQPLRCITWNVNASRASQFLSHWILYTIFIITPCCFRLDFVSRFIDIPQVYSEIQTLGFSIFAFSMFAFSKLRRVGLTNPKVDNSDSKPFKFKHHNWSGLNLLTKLDLDSRRMSIFDWLPVF